MNAAARILVATEDVADADLVTKLLRDEFDNVVGSTDPNRAVADFENHRPNVLILAFDTLAKAERYYLGLYRLGTSIHALPHRTLILCGKDDLRRVYELCRKEYFDDYVLFWPLVHDALRLPMAVHHALLQLSAATVAGGSPSVSEFAAQARRLADMESLVEQYVARGGAQIDDASRSLRRAQRDIGSALDRFAQKLSQGDMRDVVEVMDAPGFQREIDRFKGAEIAAGMDAVAAVVQPVREWAGAHKLLRNLLHDANLELVFATSATEALSSLRRRRPDLILMDVHLPDIDGVEATRRIKSVEQLAGVPVVMITGLSDKDVVVQSIKAGAAGFVVKPFNKEILLAKVRSCLNGAEGATL